MVQSLHTWIDTSDVLIGAHVVGKAFGWARLDVTGSVDCIRYYAGWADKLSGQVQEVRFQQTAAPLRGCPHFH